MKNISRLAIVAEDSWLEPVESVINDRFKAYKNRLSVINNSAGSIVDYANAHRYFGFQYDYLLKGFWFREWLPGAKDVFLFGGFNSWQRTQLRLNKDNNGVWSIFLPDSVYEDRLVHGSKIKLHIHGADDSWLDRIPAYITRVVQDDVTKDFTGQLWFPSKPFDWSGDNFSVKSLNELLIYECHIGMAQEEEGVGTYTEFTEKNLDYIKSLGYNAIQLMAVAEHPYYGSFGYHVSSLYAPSSRFGTPEELKELVKQAHKKGLAVIMDLVHSHYVKNINEGINRLDGTDYLYSPAGEAGNQNYWDSKNYDYSKPQIEHFLLSNIKYWLEEFHFDGFRFDGVTSMVYKHHGYTEFDSRDKFFDDTVNTPALTYLTLANNLIHTLGDYITIAEDVSGMPGMCIDIEKGGVGFDYRLAMSIPDYWIKLLKDQSDQEWNLEEMWHMMTNRLAEVGTVTYCESHDQALVGDQTIAFRLMAAKMYDSMHIEAKDIVLDRGIALHKMIRLFTIALGGNAYLNFMGNEFGHPEWIDFPRAGNDWSYKHARRLWSLAENENLKYKYLLQFDKDMISLVKSHDILNSGYGYKLMTDEENKTIVFSHSDLVFIFNWHTDKSIPDYIIPLREPGKYKVVMSTDDIKYGGLDRIDCSKEIFSFPNDSEKETRHYAQIYNINRACLVLQKVD